MIAVFLKEGYSFISWSKTWCLYVWRKRTFSHFAQITKNNFSSFQGWLVVFQKKKISCNEESAHTSLWSLKVTNQGCDDGEV